MVPPADLRALDVRLLSIASGLGRLAIGGGLGFAPRMVLRLLGFPEPPAAAVTIARVAASRDLVLGAATLGALSDREQLRRASLANAVADGGDTLTFAIALADPAQRAAGLRGVAAALPATLAGLWVAVRLRPDQR